MVDACLVQESVWFDQHKFEEAEARYQQTLAQRHSGLRVEGKVIASTLASQLEEARSFIEQSLKTAPAAGGRKAGDLEQRVSQLERENKDLKQALQSVQSRLSSLEAKVSRLGGGGGGGELPKAQQKEEEEEDGFDLFGSDEEEEDAEAERLKQKRVAEYQAKKAKKPQVVAKSNIILEVKPWGDDTDMAEVERLVRSVATDGLLWGASKLVPVGYGIRKLQISCVVEDEKVGTDFLEESITAFEDHVQSVDIVAFNKI